MTEVEGKTTCNIMGKTVAAGRRPGEPVGWRAEAASLYAPNGARKYLNLSERALLIQRLSALPAERRVFVLTLVWTGARVSEVLALTRASFQLDAGLVAITTLKRRRPVIREIPIPPALMAELDAVFGLRSSAQGAWLPLWRFHRVTAWRIIKSAMENVGIEGVRATPRGLRHAFGVGTLAAGVPLTLVQRLLGHSSVETTAIYTDAVGPERRALTARFWR